MILLLRPKKIIFLTLGLFCTFSLGQPCLSQDIPEEILRAETITQARSSVDGAVLNPAEQATLTEELQVSSFAPQLDSNLRQLIFLLQLRQFLNVTFPLF